MEHVSSEQISVRELFECMRKLAGSQDLVEGLRTLWIGALLGERLERCSDYQIGDLLSVVQDSLVIFSAEFAVCEYAKRRLQRRHSWRQ